MPLLFVHGVATRTSSQYQAIVLQRNSLFRSLVFRSSEALVLNPDWGSYAVDFAANLPWLPKPRGNETLGAASELAAPAAIALNDLAMTDVEQAIDLVVMAALEKQIAIAQEFALPARAADPETIEFACLAGDYLAANGLLQDSPQGSEALRSGSNDAFAEALRRGLTPRAAPQSFSALDKIREAIGAIGGVIGNSASDALLRAKRRNLSRAVAFFLGDIFVYLGKRDVVGQQGTRARIFAPIMTDLVKAARARRAREPLIVVGHSLGGVILYDLLTDATALAQVEEGIGQPLRIDSLVTVGSQVGFFADLGLYAARPTADAKLSLPSSVGSWLNVFDFTDVFSFLCAPMFAGAQDFGYDTAVDLRHAHSAYFQRPSFYRRLRARLEGAGLL